MFYAKIEFLTYKDIISQIHMSNGDIFAHCCKNWIENWFYIKVSMQIGRYVFKKVEMQYTKCTIWSIVVFDF